MASVVVDSVLVEAGWDPSALERGIVRSERLVRDFVARAGATVRPVDLQIQVAADLRPLDELNARVKAVRQQAEQPIAIPLVTPLSSKLPPVVASPPIVLPPPDFSAVVAATQKTVAQVRDAFIRGLNAGGVMEHSGIAAGVAVVRGLEAGAKSQLAGLGTQVAKGLIDPAAAVKQADLIIQTLKQEIESRQGELAALVSQARQRALGTGTTPNVSGVTTARTGIGSSAELNEAEEAFDNLTGAAAATNQQFVKIGSSSSQMRQGLRSIGTSMASLGAQAVGAETQVGNLAQQLVFFAGTGPALAAAGGFLAFALAYERLSAGARLAREEQNKLAGALSSRFAAGPQDTGLAVEQLQSGQIRGLTVIETLDRQIAAARGRQRDLQQEITSGLPAEVGGFSDVLAAAGRVLGIQVALLDPVTRMLEKLRLERDVRLGILALVAEEAALSNANLASRKAQTESGVAFTNSFAGALQAQVKIGDSTRLTAVYAAELRKLIAGGTQDYATQVAAVAALNALEKGRVAGLEQTAALQQQAATKQSQILQELTSQQDALFAPVTIDLDVSDALGKLTALQGALQKTADQLRARARPLLASPVTADLGKQMTQQADQIDAFNRKVDADSIRFEERRLNRLQAGAAASLQALTQAAEAQPTVLLPVQLDVTAAVAQLEEARQAVADRVAAFAAAGQAIPPQDLAKLTELEGQIRSAMELPAKVLIDSTSALGDRLASLGAIAENARQLITQGVDRPETVTEIADRERALLPILDTLRARYETITAAIADQATPQSLVNALLREQGAILGQLAAHRVPTLFEVTSLQPIEEAAQRYADAKQKFEAAVAAELPKAAAAAAEEMDAAGKALDAASQRTIRAVLALKLDANVTKLILDAIKKAYQNAGREAHELSQKTKEVIEGLGFFSQFVGGIRQVGEAFGVIDEGAARALQSVQDLADGIGRIASGDILGGAIQGLSAIGGLFGKSASDQEHDRILAENNQRLGELASSLDRSLQGIGGTVKLDTAVVQAAAAASRALQEPRLGKGATNADVVTRQVAAAAAAAGLTLQQFADQVKSITGLDILDSKGKVLFTTLGQVDEALQSMIAAATRFQDTFADQLDFADLQARISGGIGDAVDQFQRDLGAAGTVDATFIQDFFDGIDIRGDADAFQKRLQELLALFAPDSTFFKEHPELLGGLTPEDWRKLLNDGADAMDTLRDKTLDAARVLGDLNLPQGFRRAAIAFETGDTGPDVARLTARTAAVAALFPTAVDIQPLPDDAQALLDRIAKQAPPDLLAAVNRVGDLIQASQPAAAGEFAAGTQPTSPFASPTRAQSVTITFGDIHVHIEGGQAKDAKQIAQETVAEFRRIAMAQSGDTLQVGLF